MSNYAIQVEGLGKEYIEGYGTALAGVDSINIYKTTSAETQCAAEGHDHCVFTVKPL